MPFNVIFEIFDTTVVPILTYSSEIWGYEAQKCIEETQTKFCKYLLCVNSRTSNSAVLGECGRLPIFIKTYVICIKYWIKVTRMNSVRLPKAAYIQLYESCENGKINWVTHIKNLLFRYGFGIVFFYQDVGDESLFVSQFKQIVIDCYKQDWNASMNDSPKMCSYKEYKVDFICEKYLDVLNI